MRANDEVNEADNFAHGSYADYAGVVFYGPPTHGFWLDRLAISDRYITPLFAATLDRAQAAGKQAPRLVRDWVALEGWEAAGETVRVPPREAEELVDSLAGVTTDDIAPHSMGASPNECLRCSDAIRRFLSERLSRGVDLFIERE